MRKIVIRGAREHNLKGIDLEVPHGAFVCFVGPSGSGKSTLVFDVIGREAERRFLEALSPSLRQLIGGVRRPAVDRIEGLAPAVILTRARRAYGPRSTVGTATEVYDLLRILFARAGEAHCPGCGRSIRGLSREEMVKEILALEGERVMIAIPGEGQGPEEFLRDGFVRAVVGGEAVELEGLPRGTPFDVLVDRLLVSPHEEGRVRESLDLALRYSGVVKVLRGEEVLYLSRDPYCPACDRPFPPLTPALFSFNLPEGACPSCGGLGEKDGRICPGCGGLRLRPEALKVKVGGYTIADLTTIPIRTLREVLGSLEVPLHLQEVVEEVQERLGILDRFGLGYLSLARSMDSLSQGEAQRVRLCSELVMGLTGVMYLVDEPTVALHPVDQRKVLEVLKGLREQGNTVLCVEHDPDTLFEADWVVELGPSGGGEGGRLVFAGRPEELLRAETPTGRYLRERPEGRWRRRLHPSGTVRIRGARLHNLKDVAADFPLGVLCAVCGVSGSGKSTLVVGVLAEDLKRVLKGEAPQWSKEVKVEGEVRRVVVVDQRPPGRDPRSTPATYVGAFDLIREVFSRTHWARVKGWGPERFSFNVKGGRCEVCKGLGKVRVDLGYLPELYVTCEHCGGSRYSRDVLEVKYRGLNIADVLALTVNQALDFFKNLHPIREKLEPLQWVGLGYLQLGQPLSTLSGGEAQRLKIAKELAARPEGTLYILDEPTVGLHPSEVKNLLEVLDRLIDQGASVICIEHDRDLLLQVDHILELGPGGGDEGGLVIAQGPPEEVLPRSGLYQ